MPRLSFSEILWPDSLLRPPRREQGLDSDTSVTVALGVRVNAPGLGQVTPQDSLVGRARSMQEYGVNVAKSKTTPPRGQEKTTWLSPRFPLTHIDPPEVPLRGHRTL